jgi:eukaryotic-like serine/threonine-protein kinase
MRFLAVSHTQTNFPARFPRRWRMLNWYRSGILQAETISMSERSIFIAALEKDDAAERAAYLDRACALDLPLRERIERLLKAHEPADSFLERGPSVLDATDNYEPIAERAGTVIGPYKLLQQIGEGGMGAVFMAEQTRPVQRKVALKIIKPGMDSAQVIARFEAERQALAMMAHQNIARVLDAGTTEGGRPYFVMELVHGVPITQFCDDRKLTPRERLELCVPVCQAIQHAHQKGIIHRDIKPSNVLVTMYDDEPVPKVIDFGVAKAIEQRLTERTMFTQYGALVGTFEYMSPEQAEMNAFGVDTRSDVYSLGVLLYELLTGTTPLEKVRLRQAALDEMVRLIKEVEAPRPSLRLSSSNDLPKIAAARNTEPTRLSGMVRGEIDWIVMKCLEKDRTRRYDSASALTRDIQRHLADEPVEACPPSVRYRLRKLARKYRTPMLVAGGFVLLLVLGALVATWQAVRARSAERAAQFSAAVARSRELEADEARGQAEKRRDGMEKLNEDLRRTHYVEDMNLARVAWDENNLVLTHELLEKSRPRPGEPDLRGFEWYYLDRLARGGQLRIDAHIGGVNSVAFMPDGKRLFSSGIAQPLRRVRATKDTSDAISLWDAATGRPIPLQLDGLSDKVAAACLSPDGTHIAASPRDHTVLLWNVATGGVVTLEGPANHVASGVRFSPDGKRLVSLHRSGEHRSVGATISMRIWDLAAHKCVRTFDRVHASPVSEASFSADGRQLVVCPSSPGSFAVYDTETGREEYSCHAPDDMLEHAVFSPLGARLATWGDKGIRVWDLAKREPVAFWPSEYRHGHSLAYSRDGKQLATAGSDGTAEIWDTSSGRKVQTFKGHSGMIRAIAFSPDGARLATGGADGTVRLWDIAGSGNTALVSRPESELRSVIPDLSPDGRSLLAIRLRDDRKRIELWDTATRLMRGGPIALPEACNSWAWSTDSERLYLADAGKTVRVVETASGQEIRRFQVDANPAEYVTALSPDEKWYVYSGPGGTIRVRDVRAGVEARTIPWQGDDPQDLMFSPDGSRLLGADLSGNLKLWDFATGREIVAKTIEGLYVNKSQFSRDGALVAVMGNRFGLMTGELHVLDATSAREAWSLRGHTLNVTDADFSPDGRRLVTASADGTVRFWDLGTGRETLKLRGDPLVTTVRFISGGQRVIGGSMDRTIRVWDAMPLEE